jgi:hypothetical protein
MINRTRPKFAVGNRVRVHNNRYLSTVTSRTWDEDVGSYLYATDCTPGTQECPNNLLEHEMHRPHYWEK